MKKIGLVMLLLCSFWANAQQKEIQNNTVIVSGRALIERTTTLHRAKITLNMESLYYSDPTIKTLEDLKNRYFKELKAHNIDPTRLKENKLEFIAYGYQRDGTLFELETSSEEEIKELAQIKIGGVTVQYQFKEIVTLEQRNALLEESLANAKENAQRVCKIADKKLGAIISISDNQLQQTIWNSSPNAYEEYATIYVTYAMN